MEVEHAGVRLGVSIVNQEGPGRELFRWDWHPLTTPRRTQPHLHVRAEQPILSTPIERWHIPTGRVAFEEVVRFLILELVTEYNRDDWVEILAESEERFKAFRTWA